MKTSAGKKGVDSGKVSRRFELVRELRLAPERPDRRFRIGIADNLFGESSKVKEPVPSVADELPIESPTIIHRHEQPESSQTELLIGLAAVAGLALGYLIGKKRK